jgi:hypothetical protein
MSTTKLAKAATRQINAVVVSAGLMQKTVKVRVGEQQWNGHIKKVGSSISPACTLHSYFSIFVFSKQRHERNGRGDMADDC